MRNCSLTLFFSLFAVVGLLVSAPSGAVELPDDPGFGILGMADTEMYGPESNNSIFGGPNTVADIYFILVYPEYGGLGGAEFALRFDPPGFEANITTLGIELPGEGLIIEPQPYEFVIGYTTPLNLSGNQVLMMRWTVLLLTDGTGTIALGPVSNPTIPGEMAYTSWSNPADVRMMRPFSNGFSHEMPVFGINTEVIGTEATSWSQVKALFD